MLSNNKHKLVAGLASNKLADLLISAKTTLPALLLSAGAPVWIVGWLVPIRESGALLPQALLGVLLRRFARRHRVWRVGIVIQILAALMIALGGAFLSGLHAGIVVLVGLIILSIGRSVCSLTMKDIQGSVADKGERGGLIGIASTASGLITLIVAVPLLFFSESLGNAVAIALVFGSAACLALALAFIYPVKTRVDVSESSQSAGFSLNQFDSVVYKFIAVRGLFVHSALVAPYFMVQSKHDAMNLLPYYLGAQALATMLSSFFWGKLADYSAKLTLQLAGAVAIIACVGLLTITEQAIWFSGVLFFILAVAHTGVRNGRKTYSLDVKEGQKRTELVAFSNTAIGIILIAFGGFYSWLKTAYDVDLVMIMACMLVVGVALSFILPSEKNAEA